MRRAGLGQDRMHHGRAFNLAGYEQFQAKLVADGYRINTFKITEGNCYEIYGFDREGRKVEIYHDPVSGNAVKTESKD